MPLMPDREEALQHIRSILAVGPEDHTIFMLRRGRHQYSFHRYMPTECAQWMHDITRYVGVLTDQVVHDDDKHYWCIHTSDPQGIVQQLAINVCGNHYDLRYEFI